MFRLYWIFLMAMLSACSSPQEPSMSLYRAVQMDDLDQVKRHLHWKTPLNELDRDGQSALHVCAGKGNRVICELLIGHGAQLETLNARQQTPLLVALLNNHLAVAELLRDQGAHWEPQTMLLALIKAEVVAKDLYRLISKWGVDCNAPTAAGETPLIAAVRTHNTKVVKRLIELGATVNLASPTGETPLGVAKAEHQTFIIELLVQNGGES